MAGATNSDHLGGRGGGSSLSRRLAPCVFDTAVAAYSLRIPSGSTYSGPLLRVRRSNDNAEADIGAVLTADSNGDRWLDTASLLSFAGANSAFVTTWYDQAGKGHHAVQATAANQPRVVNAGAADALNGKPSIYWSGTTNANAGRLVTPTFMLGQPTALHMVIKADIAGVNQMLVFSPAATFEVSNTSNYIIYAGIAFPVPGWGTTPHVNSAIYAGTSSSLWVDGVNKGVGNAGNSSFTFFSFGSRLDAGVSIFTGRMPEIVVLSTLLTDAQRQQIERSQGAAFGITVA